MRKYISLIITICVLFLCLSGCRKNTQEETLPSQQATIPSSTTETTQPAISVDVQQQPMYAISLVPQLTETKDANGNVRFLYSYQNITLVMPEPEVADKIILDHLNRIDQADQYAEGLRSESLSNENINPDTPFMYSITYSPKRFDNAILSIREDELVQSGGAHPNTYGHFYTYDLLTGDLLNLSNVLTDGISTESLANSVITSLAETDGLYEGFDDTIKDMLKAGTEEYKYWYFSENGLCFHFDPYVLAPYAAGPITAELSYSQLTGILKDEYFPSEKDYYTGNLLVDEFTADAHSNYTQFAEAVLAEDGISILLTADGLLSNIKIETVEAERNISTSVMAVQSLSPGDALMVQYDPTEVKLSVSYYNGEQAETKMISYDNGTITVS